ncbi:MAG: hypothetical protein DCC58_15235 [Chloroflexi bacterium]|nr:MAG: hypothetical protein DCC58_15235 [Chloroflexota bacterium]
MLDSSGRYRMRYEDVFRALGHYIDTHRFKDIVIVEVPDGFLIKGQVLQEAAAGVIAVPQTYLFTNEDIDVILEDAAKRRRSSSRG